MKALCIAALAAIFFCAPIAAAADCLPLSQTAITTAQAMNAYSIMRYDWQGDKRYDQVVEWCGSSPIREPLCNAGVNVGVRALEHGIVTRDPSARRWICPVNWAGALAFSVYVRHAVDVQIVHIRF